MTRVAINWDSIPSQFLYERPLRVCLKCGFDLLTRQMNLAARTAYSEIRKFAPDADAFRHQETQRPFFRSAQAAVSCPYCEATKRWVTTIRSVQIEEHPDLKKTVKALLTALKKKDEQYTLVKETRTPLQILADWLERQAHQCHFENDDWLRKAAMDYLKRREPLQDWEAMAKVRRVLFSNRLSEGYELSGNSLFLSPLLYGNVLVVQYLLSRTHSHGAHTFEGRLTAFEFYQRLRRSGWLHKQNLHAEDAGEALEGAVARLAEEVPFKTHFVIDRTAFLDQLKTLYDKMKK
jgi:hypothetical protein